VKGRTVRSLKIAAAIFLVLAVILELLPKTMFDSDLVNSFLRYWTQRSIWIADLKRNADSAYSGYGNKFAVSYLVSIIGFCGVTVGLILSTLRSNSQIEFSASLLEVKASRLFFLGVFASVLIFIQFAWPGLYLSHTKAATIPFLSQGLVWAFADWIIVTFLVVKRRGGWLNAA
jgi:hypothetical protein